MKQAYKDGYLQIDLNKKVEVVIQAGNMKELVLK